MWTSWACLFAYALEQVSIAQIIKLVQYRMSMINTCTNTLSSMLQGKKRPISISKYSGGG